MVLTRGMGSFRQLLLVAFLLIAALLGGTALRAVVILDRLMAQSAEESARALALSASAQSIAPITAGMERAARQSLILNDGVLRRRFNEESANARNALDQMAKAGVPARATQAWREQVHKITALLEGGGDNLERERAVAAEFRELDAMNNGLVREVQGLITGRDRALRERHDESRARLTQQVVVAIALSIVLAFGLGLWLARPFGRLKKAIVGLGENRLDDPIDIRGPADVRGLSQQLDWLRLRLMELDADKSRFLRHVSHELKTPLAALREGVALLEDGVTGELNAGQREVIHILQQNTLALQGQIEALLRFNAAAFEARQLRRENTGLVQLVEEQVEAQRLQWQARQVAVRIDGDAPPVPVDRDKLGIAIGNLLSNAIRFSPRGGEIRIAIASNGRTATMDFRDQGPGIAEADRPRVFEPFYRGERQPEGAVRGTGIGLSIVREYIAAHGGEIALLSDGGGAHFRIELPHAS